MPYASDINATRGGFAPRLGTMLGDFYGLDTEWDAKTQRIAGGDTGVRTTLSHMVRLARGESGAPVVRELCFSLAGYGRPDNQADIVKALSVALPRHFRYVRDPLGSEYLTGPRAHASRIRHHGIAFGDCDDLATLQAALLGAVGIPCRFRAIASGRKGPTLNHVRCEALVKGQWLSMDFLVRPGARFVRSITVEV
jgi:transglutaminase-like putative cysteine protease